MNEYAFTARFIADVVVTAETLEDARLALRDIVGRDPAQPLATGIFNASVVVRAVTLDRDEGIVFHVGRESIDIRDMAAPVACGSELREDNPDCELAYDEARGDGYAGSCPSCADREHVADGRRCKVGRPLQGKGG